MILKILKTQDGHLEDGDWWMLDNIRRVCKGSRYRKLDQAGPEVNVEDSRVIFWDLLLSDIKVESEHDDKPFDYVHLLCHLVDGSKVAILFNTTAYLCNDAGKTIEKIVPTRQAHVKCALISAPNKER